MSPIAVITGTFLVWIIAKGELSTYAAFVTTKSTTSSSPSSGSVAGASTPQSGASAAGSYQNIAASTLSAIQGYGVSTA